MEQVISKIKTGNLVVTATCLVMGVGLWVAFRDKLPPQVPLLYTKPWGEGQLVRPVFLLAIPIISSGVGLVLGWLSEKLKQEMPLATMVVSTGIVIQVVVILAMLRVAFLVM